MIKVSSLLLSKVTKDIYDLSHHQPTDALVMTASGSLLPYKSHEHPSQRRYYPSIMMVDEMSLMSDCINIPIRVRRMMDEEAHTISKVSEKLYSGPLTSSTTIYPGSTNSHLPRRANNIKK